jgi:hypothetical protein
MLVVTQSSRPATFTQPIIVAWAALLTFRIRILKGPKEEAHRGKRIVVVHLVAHNSTLRHTQLVSIYPPEKGPWTLHWLPPFSGGGFSGRDDWLVHGAHAPTTIHAIKVCKAFRALCWVHHVMLILRQDANGRQPCTVGCLALQGCQDSQPVSRNTFPIYIKPNTPLVDV